MYYKGSGVQIIPPSWGDSGFELSPHTLQIWGDNKNYPPIPLRYGGIIIPSWEGGEIRINGFMSFLAPLGAPEKNAPFVTLSRRFPLFLERFGTVFQISNNYPPIICDKLSPHTLQIWGDNVINYPPIPFRYGGIKYQIIPPCPPNMGG